MAIGTIISVTLIGLLTPMFLLYIGHGFVIVAIVVLLRVLLYKLPINVNVFIVGFINLVISLIYGFGWFQYQKGLLVSNDPLACKVFCSPEVPFLMGFGAFVLGGIGFFLGKYLSAYLQKKRQS